MTQLSIDDLRRVLVDCAGEREGLAVGGDIAELTFEELGYDSLALIETAAKLKQRFDIDIEDDKVVTAETLGALLGLANAAVAQEAGR
ncbi:acyl carrier protein [Nonomuraea sp. NPDC046802]|uniref:acyl carrier protein n=1 Tax=Nonomuraea sp. NPDC046802 TaxID=3154919 RepID=UPI0033FB7E55